ncbi:MAG TPA: hypothetical protein PL059_09705 [Spirochaetota bacterium]|nr:hypothetical protein [Spirochaetota bacterium]HOM10086.1 hypothetical protein [Spirochaetota bacterium]HPP49150.1 hypothetical protein [Spirochaetota bacterium]
MSKKIIYTILSLLITICLHCSKQVLQSPPPEQSQIPDIQSTNIILECLQKSNNGYPFVELSLIIENTGRYFVATVYGQIYQIYSKPPVFAPPYATCGVSIKNNNTIHYFFVYANATTDIIAVQSLVEKVSDNYINTMDYQTIIKIPVQLHNRIQSTVTVK